MDLVEESIGLEWLEASRVVEEAMKVVEQVEEELMQVHQQIIHQSPYHYYYWRMRIEMVLRLVLMESLEQDEEQYYSRMVEWLQDSLSPSR